MTQETQSQAPECITPTMVLLNNTREWWFHEYEGNHVSQRFVTRNEALSALSPISPTRIEWE